MGIVLIVPTRGHFDYALRTVRSFFTHSPTDSWAYVIDDASPDWNTEQWSEFERTRLHHFPVREGLTRSWNLGLQLGEAQGVTQIICGNSDLLFTPGWYEPMLKALERFKLVGPMTNAPGRVVTQDIRGVCKPYHLTDDPAYLTKLAHELRDQYEDSAKSVDRVNGFFMMANTSTWQEGAYDDAHVFNPQTSMKKTAYELQIRWKHKKWLIGAVQSSFIFHYRSVSRGWQGLTDGCGKGMYRHRGPDAT